MWRQVPAEEYVQPIIIDRVENGWRVSRYFHLKVSQCRFQSDKSKTFNRNHFSICLEVNWSNTHAQTHCGDARWCAVHILSAIIDKINGDYHRVHRFVSFRSDEMSSSTLTLSPFVRPVPFPSLSVSPSVSDGRQQWRHRTGVCVYWYLLELMIERWGKRTKRRRRKKFNERRNGERKRKCLCIDLLSLSFVSRRIFYSKQKKT